MDIGEYTLTMEGVLVLSGKMVLNGTVLVKIDN